MINTRLAITELEGRQQVGAHESRKPFEVGKRKRKTKTKKQGISIEDGPS